MKDILITGGRGTGKTTKGLEKFVKIVIDNDFDEHFIISNNFEYYETKKDVIKNIKDLFEKEKFEVKINYVKNDIYLKSEKRNVKIKLCIEDLRICRSFHFSPNKKILVWVDEIKSFNNLGDFLEYRNEESKFIISTSLSHCPVS